MEILVGIVSFKDLKMENGADSLPEGDLEMGIKFYLPFHGDSVPKHFIKITYIRILYILYLFIFSYNICINLFTSDIYYCHKTQINIFNFLFVL
jgi:hypothetical protein